MTLAELKSRLAESPAGSVRFVLPDGSEVAAHAHVTEVARIDKRYVDCGGTRRVDSFCRLQVWVADDREHRLGAGKLAGILDKAAPVLGDDDLAVDVEIEREFITQFPLASVEAADGEVNLRLALRHTDCLARELCLPAAGASQPIQFGRRKA